MSTIQGYHAHVYFEFSRAGLGTAMPLYGGIASAFGQEILGRIHEAPIGPHTQAMFQVTISCDQFAQIVPWLMLNRDGLSVLVHPLTGDEVADHESNALWMGTPLPLNIDALRG